MYDGTYADATVLFFVRNAKAYHFSFSGSPVQIVKQRFLADQDFPHLTSPVRIKCTFPCVTSLQAVCSDSPFTASVHFLMVSISIGISREKPAVSMNYTVYMILIQLHTNSFLLAFKRLTLLIS